jgi:hypothetical protein
MSSLTQVLSEFQSPVQGELVADAEPLAAPFRIVADFREALDGWQFAHVPDCEQPGRYWGAAVEYRYLETADYTVAGVPLFIVRHEADEFLGLQRHWPDGLARELAQLDELEREGAACLIVIEGDAQTVAQLLSGGDSLLSGEADAPEPVGDDIPWLLVESRQSAEWMVFNVMRRAWERMHAEQPQ